MPVLTAIDALGVQPFIFSTNRLRDVVAGSYLIHWSTSLDGMLDTLVPKEKILLAGGGNAMIEFDSIEKAKEFSSNYTRRLYDEIPGLDVAIAHLKFKSGKLAQALIDIQIELARMKSERSPSTPLLGNSVTFSCHETGLPASGYEEKKNLDLTGDEIAFPLSKEIMKRREVLHKANAHWSEYLKGKNGFAFPLELDKLGRTLHDKSLIGVVHIDGNGVGKMIKDWITKMAQQEAPDDLVKSEYHEWSKGIDLLGKKAMQAMVDRICSSIQDAKGSKKITGTPEHLNFELKQEKTEWFLPLRPILLGGDDITFVCDGRIALDMAQTALGIFENDSVPHLKKISACAGVALVRVHEPFARAYKLSEKLCASSKEKAKCESCCVLDWHIGIHRPGESINQIRERQYKVPKQELTCRPYLLGMNIDESETWCWLSKTLLDDSKFGLRGGQWSRRRNKVKALSQLVREGPDSLELALGRWRIMDQNLSLPKDISINGFIANRTPLLDALELIDVHFALDPSASNHHP